MGSRNILIVLKLTRLRYSTGKSNLPPLYFTVKQWDADPFCLLAKRNG